MRPTFSLLITTLLCLASTVSVSEIRSPVVIAHRGASGYLPEHTLEAKTLAYAMRADYIEQDLVLSKDDHLIVMHDIYLDNVTNVRDLFPGRAREDGHFYTIDFTLEELKQLQVTGPFVSVLGNPLPQYKQRFPLWKSRFELATFEEELELIQGLNQSLGYGVGIYPEIKKPWFHLHEGKDISRAVLKTLKHYGYTGRDNKVFLQAFDAEELQRIHAELMPALEMDLPLVQLIAETEWEEKRLPEDGGWTNYDYDWMRTPTGLQKISTYAVGIGPWHPMLLGQDGQVNTLVAEAQRLGLKVHPFTFRADPGQVPERFDSFEDFARFYLEEVKVDGLFTDHPDKVRALRQKRSLHND
ncbi:glycerophosphodiester phosphodiesterase [Microbulbifer elongatus]|uniref:glycerophosphodiester phosphodiesterase n=1 Tax=Microbulbifer elongatus TaxID=86173 RepID=UPI001E5D45FA|nr:glycerophosphodiester phosphodiesterase [Microbulbifer elongatus]